MELKKLNPTMATLAAPQAHITTPLKPAKVNAVDAFEAAKAPAFQKPNFRRVTAERPGEDWGDNELIYRVRSGDTLSGIARTLGTSVGALQQWNSELAEQPNKIQVGQKIILPSTFHIVSAGETYWSIARKTGLSTQALMTLNDAPANGALKIGQEIKVPAAILSPEQAALRAKLKDVIADDARAFEATTTGPGTTNAYDGGDSMGWWGAYETGASYEYSDDYKSAKIWMGEEDTPVVISLTDPVADTRRAIVKNAIYDVASTYAWAQWESKGDQNAPYPEVNPTQLPDGRTQFIVNDAAQGDLTITYDPKAETVSLEGGDHLPWQAPATSAEAAAKSLGARMGVKMPSNPIDEIPEEPGIQ